MKHIFYFALFTMILSSPMVEAEEAGPASSASSGFHYFPEVKTIFPIFLGAGVGVSFQEHFELDALYGVTPKPYYETIGSTAASLGGNAVYKNVIESAFQNNSLWRVGIKYNFNETKRGWHMGLAYSKLTASGKAGIDSVLSAATGLDYTQLKNALAAAGKSTLVDMDSVLNIGEIQTGYTWEILTNFTVRATLGVAKVLSSDVKLKTGLANFEATNAGKTLMSNSENELESIIDQYGITPTLGLSFSYVF